MSTLLILKPEAGLPLEISAEAVRLKNEAVIALGDITQVTTEEELRAAAGVLAKGALTTKQMEEARVAVKAPVLDAGKRIDDMAKSFRVPIEQEINRVKQLVSTYQAAEAKRVREENEKREREEREAAQKAERERQAEERRIREAAEVERQRLAKEAEIAAKAAEDAKQAEDPLADARRASIEADNQRIEQERRELAAREADALARQESDRLNAQTAVSVRPAEVTKVKGLATRTHWTFEVTNLSELCLARADLVTLTAKTADINAAIRLGLRECPGLRIYETTDTSVRTYAK